MNDQELQTKIKIIEKLIEAGNSERVYFIRNFESMGYNKKVVKKILTDLKNIDMVEVTYCVDDDGMINGRGYVLTNRATQWSIREWLRELKKLSPESKTEI